jgi:hypothetical protein
MAEGAENGMWDKSLLPMGEENVLQGNSFFLILTLDCGYISGAGGRSPNFPIFLSWNEP